MLALRRMWDKQRSVQIRATRSEPESAPEEMCSQESGLFRFLHVLLVFDSSRNLETEQQ